MRAYRKQGVRLSVLDRARTWDWAPRLMVGLQDVSWKHVCAASPQATGPNPIMDTGLSLRALRVREPRRQHCKSRFLSVTLEAWL